MHYFIFRDVERANAGQSGITRRTVVREYWSHESGGGRWVEDQALRTIWASRQGAEGIRDKYASQQGSAKIGQLP